MDLETAMTSVNPLALKAVCVIILVTVATACGQAPSTPTGAGAEPLGQPGEPVDGDWLMTHLAFEPGHLNPLTSSEVPASTVNAFIFESLIEWDNETLAKKPRLAERWEVLPDHLSYTFYLHKDIPFSDGTPLTANDVKFTFDKVMDPTTDAPHFRNYFQDIKSCEVLDDHTVRFTCSKPYFRHLTMLGGLEILPQHIYGQGDFNRHPNNRKPVGSGPYAFERWETGLQITLTRNERYWKEKPRILKRVFKIITDRNAAFEVLQRQELDYVNLTPEQWVLKASKPEFEAKFNKYKYYGASYSYVGWNLRRPQFQDKMVRRALTMLLDRTTILETLYYGLGKQVTSEFFVESPEYDATIEPWPYDPAQAKQLLDAAGWVDSDQDGIRDKGGVPFRFEMLIRASSWEDNEMATVYQENLKGAGIRITIRPLEWATFLERVDTRNFDAVRLGWSGPPIEGDPYQVWHSSQAEKGSNFVGFKNVEADRIMDQARLEFDEPKRVALYHRFDAILHEEQPYTFLFCIQELEALDKRFQNVKVYKFGLDSREWYVPANQQRYR
jgi:peptide/nickel transport system substrate-binding protein